MLIMVDLIRWPHEKEDKTKFKRCLIRIIYVTILITFCIKFIFGFQPKCLFLDVINTFIFLIGIVGFIIYFVMYIKKGLAVGTASLILVMAFGLPTLYSISLNPIVEECNQIEPLTLEQYIEKYVKCAVYIYDNKQGHENITMIVCNNGTETLTDNIIIKLFFYNTSYNVQVREIEGHNDISSWWKYPTIWQHPNKNMTSIEYSSPNFTITLGNNEGEGYLGCKYANFTISWNDTNDFIKPLYRIWIGKYQPYIARILDNPPIQIIPDTTSWNMDVIFDEIIDYESNKKADW